MLFQARAQVTHFDFFENEFTSLSSNGQMDNLSKTVFLEIGPETWLDSSEMV